MSTFKLTSVFAAGLLCGLLAQWMPAPAASASDRDGSNDSGGGDGGVAGSGGTAGGVGNCVADIAPSPDGNGIVNVDDLLAVINNWGVCVPPCNPTGSWGNAVAPVYQCASGTFSLHVQNWSFTQTGTTLRITGGGIPGDMIGPAVVCQAGNMFTVSTSAPAGCTITYTLTGTFSSSTHFTGTFTVTFSSGVGCTNCFNQSFNINATKQ